MHKTHIFFLPTYLPYFFSDRYRKHIKAISSSLSYQHCYVNFFIEKYFVRKTSLKIVGLSSIPAVSMDRWRSPSDNRYARNAGVSIRYKKIKKNRLDTFATRQNCRFQPEIFFLKVKISEKLPQFINGS